MVELSSGAMMSEKLRNDFRDLEAWQKCRNIKVTIWKVCKTFPVAEKFRLTDQMIRASRSSTANIAEGYGFNQRFDFGYSRPQWIY